MEVSMSTLFYLSSAQMDVIRPLFPRSRGIPRRDDQKIISELSMFSSSVSDGRMLQKNTAPIKLFITVLSDGVTWASSKRFLRLFPKVPRTHPFSWLMLPVWKLTELPQVWEKKGFLSLYRTHKRRIEHQITCSLRLRRTFNSDIADSRNHQWLWRCGMSLANSAFNPNTSCWQGLWCRMDSQFFEKSRLHSLHSFSEKYKSHEYYNKKQYLQHHKIEHMFSRWMTGVT